MNVNSIIGTVTILSSVSYVGPQPEIPIQPNFIVFIADDAA